MNRKRILVTDDEPHVIRSLTFVLGKEGFDVVTAQDGEEALRVAVEQKPDLMFLDIMMPKKNGYEVCEIIRKTPDLKSMYIIMLSAKGLAIDRSNAINAGANEFMSKPFSLLDAVARVKTILN